MLRREICRKILNSRINDFTQNTEDPFAEEIPANGSIFCFMAGIGKNRWIASSLKSEAHTRTFVQHLDNTFTPQPPIRRGRLLLPTVSRYERHLTANGVPYRRLFFQCKHRREQTALDASGSELDARTAAGIVPVCERHSGTALAEHSRNRRDQRVAHFPVVSHCRAPADPVGFRVGFARIERQTVFVHALNVAARFVCVEFLWK